MLDQGHLQLLKQANLYFSWNRSLALFCVKTIKSWRERLTESKTVHLHTFPLHDGANQTINRVFEHYITNVSYLRVILGARVWIQDEAVATKLLY